MVTPQITVCSVNLHIRTSVGTSVQVTVVWLVVVGQLPQFDARMLYWMASRPWRIMLRFLPIFLFFHSPIFHLFFLLFNPFFFSMYLFFSNMLAEKHSFFCITIYVHLTNKKIIA